MADDPVFLITGASSGIGRACGGLRRSGGVRAPGARVREARRRSVARDRCTRRLRCARQVARDNEVELDVAALAHDVAQGAATDLALEPPPPDPGVRTTYDVDPNQP